MSITVKNAKDYFGVYLNSITNAPNTTTTQSPPVQVSEIPKDVTLETLIALTTYKPETFQGSPLQKYGQNTQIVQSAVTNRLITDNNLLVNNLSNFRPSNFSGNAIQRRRNGVALPLNARGFILRGINPETQRALRILEDARRLIRARNDIARQVRRIENQINRFAAIFNALVNLPGAAASAAITKLIDILTKLQATYDALKRAAQLVASALRAIRDKWRAWKARREQAKQVEKKAEDIYSRLSKAPERPRIILFPKFPKRPRLNWSRADFYQKYRRALENLKNKDGEFYKQAYAVAYANAGFEVVNNQGTPKINPFTGQVEKDRLGRVIYNRPDAIQRGLRDTRNALRRARANIETAQTVRTAAVNQARLQLIEQVRRTAATVEEGRKRAIQEYQNAVERRNQIFARKRYLRASEQLTTDISIDLNFTNVFGDKPTGEVSSEGKKVYKDESAKRQQGSITVYDEGYGQKYVLVGITERVTAVRNNIEAAVLGTAQKITNVVNTAANAVNVVGNTAFDIVNTVQVLSGSLNDKQIAAELAAGIVDSANRTNAYASAITDIATQQVKTQQQAEENARIQADVAAQTQLRAAFSASVANGYSGSLASFTATVPQASIYIPVLYRVVSDGVRFRQQPSLSGPFKQLTSDVGLNLVTELVNNKPMPIPFVSANGYNWGKFKIISTGETGWIAINLITPRISLVDTTRPQESTFVGNDIIERPPVAVVESSPPPQLPEDPRLSFEEEVNRPNVNVSNVGTTAKISFNANSNRNPRLNAEYSLDNGQNWVVLNPPQTSGDITLRLENNRGYIVRVRGILADGTKTPSSQPKALLIRENAPVITRIRKSGNTIAKIDFTEAMSSENILFYQYSLGEGNTDNWIEAIPGASTQQKAVTSPILVDNLTPGQTYNIKIRAFTNLGAGPASNAVKYTEVGEVTV